MAGEPAAPASVEEIDCALCGPAPRRPIARVSDTNLFVPGVFGLVRCGACGLVYLSPRPTADAISRYYPASYWLDPPDRSDLPQPEGAARFAVDTLAARYPGGRVLDVGCGIGIPAAWMQARGLEVVGVEPSESAAAVARERYGLEVFAGFLRDACLPAGSFDAVTFFDVLEHTHEPVAELAEARRLPRPGGMVIVKVPNVASLQARLLGSRWYHLDPPRHLYHFSPETLQRVLASAGFSGASAEAVADPPGAISFEWSIIYWLRDLQRVRKGTAASPAPAGEASVGQVYASVPKPGKRLFRWLLRRVLYAPVAIENAVGRSSALVGIAIK